MHQVIKISMDNFYLFQDEILDIENRSFKSPWSQKAFESEIKKNTSHLWALVSGERIMGYVCFWMFAMEIQIINIAVHPEKRRLHYGYLLLSKIIEESQNHGIREIWLEVRPTNHQAISLYEKIGFKEIGRRPKYYTDTNEDAILMALKIENNQIILLRRKK